MVEALELVARQGWKLLPRYRFNNETGERETGTDRPTDRQQLVWTEEGLDYVVEALELVARHGWKLLPRYRFNNETGEK